MASTFRVVQATGGRVSARPVSLATQALRGLWTVAISAVLVFAVDALADEATDAEATASTDGVSDTLEAFADKAPLSGDELNTQRAKAALEVEKVQINDQETTGGVWGNSATGNDTGNNIISEGAFMDSAGFIGTIQNTGNNVLIQNSTIVNVAVDP